MQAGDQQTFATMTMSKRMKELKVKWPRDTKKFGRRHHLIRQGSGPANLATQLIWGRSPVHHHYWLLCTETSATDCTACPGDGSDTDGGGQESTAGRHTATYSRSQPTASRGWAKSFGATSFKCDRCKAANKWTSERQCYKKGHHNAHISYTAE